MLNIGKIMSEALSVQMSGQNGISGLKNGMNLGVPGVVAGPKEIRPIVDTFVNTHGKGGIGNSSGILGSRLQSALPDGRQVVSTL